MVRRAAILAVAVAIVTLATTADAFVFDLDARSFRCFTEEVPSYEKVQVKYSILPGYAQFIDVKVTDPHNRVVFEETATDKGEYEFSSIGGDYAVCFYSRMVPGIKAIEGMQRAIHFKFAVGRDIVNYQQLATKEHLKPMEMYLRVVADGVRQMHNEYLYFKEREIQLRDTNEHLNARVQWFTVFTLVVFAAFAYWQVSHLKGYFRRKRMID